MLTFDIDFSFSFQYIVDLFFFLKLSEYMKVTNFFEMDCVAFLAFQVFFSVPVIQIYLGFSDLTQSLFLSSLYKAEWKNSF